MEHTHLDTVKLTVVVRVLAQTVDDGCKLVLGLGPTPSAYSDEYSSSTANKAKDLTTMFTQGVSSQRDSSFKLGLSGSIDVVSNVLDFSASTQSHFDAIHQLDKVYLDGNNKFALPIVNEGSTSAKKSGGCMRRLIMAPTMENILRFYSRQIIFQNSAKNLFAK